MLVHDSLRRLLLRTDQLARVPAASFAAARGRWTAAFDEFSLLVDHLRIVLHAPSVDPPPALLARIELSAAGTPVPR